MFPVTEAINGGADGGCEVASRQMVESLERELS